MKAIRKIAIMLFLLLFVTETFGVYKFAHFCGTQKTSESIFIKKVDCCCSDMEEEDDNCCTNETQVLQLKKDETLISDNTVKQPVKPIINLPYKSVLNTISVSNIFFDTSNINVTDPITFNTPLIVKYRKLLI